MKSHLLWTMLILALATGGTAEATETTSPPGPRDLLNYGETSDVAIEIADGVFQARGIGNTQLVVTDDGNVIVDTGLPNHAVRHRRLLQEVAPGPSRYLILTHAHLDHAGGSFAWVEDGTEIIAHARFPETQRYLAELRPFQMRRNRVLVFGASPDRPIDGIEDSPPPPLINPTILVDRSVKFELGGVRFEVIATPGAEGEDSVSVWLPDRNILFTGDFLGPVYPTWPNLYTLRGEKIRFAADYIASLERVIALKPEMLVPSHFEPIEGRREIQSGLERIRNAVAYVHDEVVRGMNTGKDVYQLMREVRLPERLELAEERGKVSWTVRSIWEGYAGWFHFESTPQLYAVPINDVYADLADLAGGPDPLARRAASKARAGRPLEALHLIEVALAANSNHGEALLVRLAALGQLLERSGGKTLYETQWLRYRIAETQRQLDRLGLLPVHSHTRPTQDQGTLGARAPNRPEVPAVTERPETALPADGDSR